MKINLEKRRQVMKRSMELGHCICDPRRPCPCDVFSLQGFCPCAGERPDPVDPSSVRLTERVHNAGCASKISPADLDAVLGRLPAVNDPAVISGLAAADDAAIYRISDSLCLVQTVDVFTPCVDDPRQFGRICAANCLSDIYAMGGEPRTALSILAFPSETLDGEIMYRMLAGAMETLGEAGVALVGGHSIKDEEIKLGFAVTGLIDPAVAAALEKPQPGDVLVLTKPLGTGVLTFARQVGRGHPDGLAAAEKSMAALNRDAARAMREAGATACTDITGFGLLGHLLRLARQGGLTARVFASALPAFPGALEALHEGVIPGAIERNREYVGNNVEISTGLDDVWVHLGCDAQTSGGLLIAIPPARLARLQQALAARGVPSWRIGEFAEPSAGRIVMVDGGAHGSLPRSDEPARPAEAQAAEPKLSPANNVMNASTPEPGHEPGCCADLFQGQGQAGSASETQQAFAAFMRAAQGPGVLSEKAKELVLFALVVQSRCAPCFTAHYEKALKLGLTRAELDEAAWCAIAMGGAPVRQFYQESLRAAERNTAG